jgi:spore germination protein GerM
VEAHARPCPRSQERCLLRSDPSGRRTIVRHRRDSLSERTAIVDLGGALAKPTAGSFAESAEFKALVWTLTALPGIGSVQVKLDGIRVPTLPGGHFELDEPLSRASF